MLTARLPGIPRQNRVKLILTPPGQVPHSVHALEFPDGAASAGRRSGLSPRIVAHHGATILHTHRRINAIIVSIPHKEAVRFREAVGRKGFRVEDSQPVYPLLCDTLPALGIPRIRQSGHSGSSVLCAVLDTGIDQTHPDFSGRIRVFKNFSNEGAVDRVGHGTHVAGIVGGAGHKYGGMAPEVGLVIAKVLGQDGGDDTDVIAGLSWAADQGVQVINLSLGGPGGPDDPLSRECNALAREGMIICAAAGNSGPDRSSIGSPGNASGVITVGATDKDRRLAYYSSRGPVPGKRYLKPDILCYGGGVDFNAACLYRTGIVSTKSSRKSVTPCDQERFYTRMSGTSMAAPHVTGIAALFLDLLNKYQPSWNRKKKATLVRKLLRTCVVPLEEKGLTRWDTGAGFLEPQLALAQLGIS
jgi:subtilisin family serine protease